MLNIKLLFNKTAFFLLAVFMVTALASCGFKEPPTLLKLASLPDEGKICNLAVLPFANQTEYLQADTIFGKVFVSEMISVGGFTLAQEGDVRKILQQMRILPGRVPNITQIRSIADRLGVQAVLVGTVVEMQDKKRYGSLPDPSIGVILKILEADSGRTIWATYSRREGGQYRLFMHYGLINSVSELASRMADEIVDTWYEGGLRKCED